MVPQLNAALYGQKQLRAERSEPIHSNKPLEARRRPLATAVLIVSGMCGCESAYGVIRSAELSHFPDPQCVRSVIHETQGTRDYKEWIWPEDDTVDTDSRSHHFNYKGSQASVTLALIDEGHGYVNFSHSELVYNRQLSQASVDEARRLMIEVEEGLVERCGITELEEGVRELCQGVECP
jgi:hypothetical protein